MIPRSSSSRKSKLRPLRAKAPSVLVSDAALKRRSSTKTSLSGG
jgi:hypothetical protein